MEIIPGKSSVNSLTNEKVKMKRNSLNYFRFHIYGTKWNESVFIDAKSMSLDHYKVF